MYNFSIEIAGYTIEIETIYKRSSIRCKRFISTETPDLRIQMHQEDIDSAVKAYKMEYGNNEPSERGIEFFALLGKIAEKLLEYDIILMHGAAIAINDSAFLFSAASGTGKTTHILKWISKLPEAYIINGDKPFIRFDKNDLVLACGSPWAGKENYYTNTKIPLKSIVLMERSDENHIEQVPFAEAFPLVLQQTYRPTTEEGMRRTLRLLGRLSTSVSFWKFKCNNFKEDSFQVAYNALVRDHPDF